MILINGQRIDLTIGHETRKPVRQRLVSTMLRDLEWTSEFRFSKRIPKRY
jgi:hypothetical protein